MSTRSIVINFPLEPSPAVTVMLWLLLAVAYLGTGALFAAVAQDIDLPWPVRTFIFLFWPLAVVIVIGWLFWESIRGKK